MTELPIKITVDPTFLLEKEEWIKLMKKSTINKIPSKYILRVKKYLIDCQML